MIRIPVSKKQKEEIESIYWNWISKYHLSNLLTIVENDAVFKSLIMNEKSDIDIALKKYLLSDYNELTLIKVKLDKKKEEIKTETKDYLLARYENYRNSQAAKVVKALDVTVCPYCNQNHINISYDKKGKIRLWGDMDHFYDKATYPELAICLYNLIPVCKICNQIKSSKSREIVSPYDCEKTSKIKFRTEFDEKFDLDYLQGKSQNFNIVLDDSELTLADKEEVELFDLKNRYKQLKHNVQEIIIKSKAYDMAYEKELKKKFELSDDELRSYIFGYTENHLNRILSKFNLDMMNEFRGL